MNSRRSSRKFVVITSVNEPGEAVSWFAEWRDWEVVVVGDTKTPADWTHPGVTYLDIGHQMAELGDLARALPVNTYTRKMLGYAFAIRRGATAIFESDDDNLPYEDAVQVVDRLLEVSARRRGERVRSACGWLNVYRRFGASACWPRGFPLARIRDPDSAGEPGHDDKPWAVMQFLADEDPDVDAVYRMVNGSAVFFAPHRCVVVDEGTYCPINSQATLWLPEAFPLLFLPVGLSDRVTDILRGMIALASLWRLGYSAGYHSPVVRQVRNVHNLLKDFALEVPLYLEADDWARVLLGVEGATASDCYRSAIRKLVDEDVLPNTNVELYDLFSASTAGDEVPVER